uniref:SCP domain-containing protein n=1 Tax=Mesocestoides corti TaxID=53468 RepID=A0A5K3EYW4_MESCO
MYDLICLLILILPVLAEVPNEEERKTIMEHYTDLRENVKPTASNMQMMKYSDEMENTARAIFTTCDFGDPNFEKKYPNVAIVEMSSFTRKLEYRELCLVDKGTYIYENATCNGSCQNYLRMIWANTTEVGCVLDVCKRKWYPWRTTYVIICAYRPSALVFKSRPYVEGRSCSKCPRGYNCHRKQCRKESFVVKQLNFPQCIKRSTL